MDYRNFSRLVAVVLALGLLRPPSRVAAQTTRPAVAEDVVLKAIAARLEALQNLRAEFDSTDEFHPMHPNLSGSANGLTLITKTDPEGSHQEFSFLSGRARWDFTLSAGTLAQVKSRGIVRLIKYTAAYQEGRLEFMQQRLGEAQPIGYIGNEAPLSTFEIGLGLRAAFSQQVSWLTTERLSRMSLGFRDSQPTLSEVQPSGKVYRWTFAPTHGYALVRYAVEKPQGTRDPEPNAELVVDDFRLVRGIPLPFLMTLRWLRENGTEMASRTTKVQSYRLDDPSNTADLYHVRWPKGADVEDRRSNSHVTTTVEGQVLDDATYGDLLVAQEAGREAQLKHWPPASQGSTSQP